MTEGKIVETGPTEEVFANPQHAYTRHLLAAEPKGKPPKADPTRQDGHGGRRHQGLVPDQAGLLPHRVGHIKAVDGIDVAVRAGQTLGVVGESGSGKTTLGLALLRLISSEGRIDFVGRDIDELSFNEMRPLRARHADRLPGSVRLAQPAHVGRRDRRRRAEGPRADAVRRRARRARRRRAGGGRPRSGDAASAIRTNSPAASASASRSPAPWC